MTLQHPKPAPDSGRIDTYTYQPDRIDAILDACGLISRVQSGAVTARALRYRLSPPLPPAYCNGGAAELIAAIKTAFHADDVHVSGDGASLVITVTPPRPPAARPARDTGRRPPLLLGDLLARVPSAAPVTAALGQLTSGHPLLVRLPAPDVRHILISGCTGAGKTTLLRAIVLTLAARNRQAHLQMVVIDPLAQSPGLAWMTGLPHLLRPPIAEVRAAAGALKWLAAQAVQRRREGRAEPHLVIAIDNLGTLLADRRVAIQSALADLLTGGPESGLHLVAALGESTAGLMEPALRRAFPVHVRGMQERVVAPDGLPESPGDFLLVTRRAAGESSLPFRAACPDDSPFGGLSL